ncbi:hypothetical protein AADC60_24720 [Cytobacillus pseudoceanisediminis]|uniref:Transposase-like zinc-binding protein n=1 Tax=Cytobacillus pseudoceanisediminis TaxID=3051614 RepID=A0ABZ2ZGG0_9BACI|nr:hypothetical protein [Cytobacillus sp. Bac17]
MRFNRKMTPYINDFPPESLPISSIDNIPEPPLNENYSYNKELQRILYGKQLLFENLPHSIEEIHQHYENSYISYRKGIIKTKSKIVCARCGNKDRSLFASFPCARCGEKECTYCRKCIMMGRVSECTPLIGWCGPDSVRDLTGNPLEWAGTLSPGQQVASDQVKQAVIESKELLVWAV